MCDPITLGLTALAGGAALFGSGNSDNSTPAPPPPAIPAQPASTAQTPGAVVKVGDGAAATAASVAPAYSGFTEKRVTGKPLGGLGKGGLGL